MFASPKLTDFPASVLIFYHNKCSLVKEILEIACLKPHAAFPTLYSLQTPGFSLNFTCGSGACSLFRACLIGDAGLKREGDVLSIDIAAAVEGCNKRR
jgi:hypothetical protein